MEKRFSIENIPAVLYGGNSDRVFLFLHGQGGNKEEAERFANIAVPYGYQVLGIDLPEHGGRRDRVKFLPWEVVPELRSVIKYAKERWPQISVRAVSIGVWFSLLAFAGENVERCLFSSPLFDMENMISNLMKLSGVTEEQLKAEGKISTDSGQTLSWQYLCYAREHPPCAICRDTAVLYATADEIIPPCVIESFTKNNMCRLTLLNGGQHWLHTEEQLDFIRQWEEGELKNENTCI